MAAAFPEATFDLALFTCSGATLEQFTRKAEELGSHAGPAGVHLGCQAATINSEGRHILRFTLQEGHVPLYPRPGRLTCTYTFPEPEPFEVSTTETQPHILISADFRVQAAAVRDVPWS